jgi:hypothetical protein
MSLDLAQVRDYIIEPTLEQIGLYSTAAVELLLGTALQESRLTYIKQLGGGPALGLWQMEPDTHDDIWRNWLAYRHDLACKIKTICPTARAQDLVGNNTYACAMARLHYRRVKEPLPPAGDRPGQAAYWKAHYNTILGRGTAEEYLHNWQFAHH